MWKGQASALLLVCGILLPGGAVRAQAPEARPSRSAPGPGQTAPGWLRVGPAAEEFEVSLPAMPKVSAEGLQIAGRTVVIRHYSVSADDTHYAVLAAGVPDFPGEEVAYAMMLHLCDKLFSPSTVYDTGSGAGVQTELRRELRLSGYAGREYAIRVRGSRGLLRFYNTGRNYYAAVALAAMEEHPLIARFMESFTLTAPAPVAGGRGRAGSAGAARRQAERPRAAPGETWLVILGSFAEPERAAAGRRLDLLRRAGLEARLVRTDEYPNLTKGLLAIVMGPYTKAAARGLLGRARASSKGAYIKSGW